MCYAPRLRRAFAGGLYEEKDGLITFSSIVGKIHSLASSSSIRIIGCLSIVSGLSTDSGNKDTDSGGLSTDSGNKDTDSGSSSTDSGSLSTNSGSLSSSPRLRRGASSIGGGRHSLASANESRS